VCNRNIPKSYGPKEVSNLFALNPNNDFRAVFPIEEGDWQDPHVNIVAAGTRDLLVRGRRQLIPSIEEYAHRGITLEDPPRVQVFELCCFLADVARDSVLATPEERRMSLLPAMTQILQLEESNHHSSL
jgi:hypothetical protein